MTRATEVDRHAPVHLRSCPSNTGATVKSDREWHIVEAGVHTVGLVIPVEARPPGVRASGLTVYGGHRLRWRSDVGMVVVETTPGESGLCPLWMVRSSIADVVASVAALGVDPIGPVRLVRADVAASCMFARSTLAADVLAMAARCLVPRLQPRTYGRPLETVEFYPPRGRRPVAVIYDKGRESRTVAPGRLLRFEARRHWRGRGQPDLASMTPGAWKAIFDSRFRSFREAAGASYETSEMAAHAALAERVQRGEVAAGLAEAAISAVFFERYGLCHLQSESTRRRRRAAMRRAGLPDPRSPAYQVTEFDARGLFGALLSGAVWGVVVESETLAKPGRSDGDSEA